MSIGIRKIVAGLVLAVAAGYGVINSAWEYVQVGVKQFGKGITNNMPMSVEVGRLELLLENIEQELDDSRRSRAEAALVVDKARAQVRDIREKLLGQMEDMASIRQYLPGGCKADDLCSHNDRAELEQALKARLSRYKRDTQSLAQQEEATKRLESSHAELAQRIDERSRQRDFLVQRLEMIRTDKATLELVGGATGSLPSGDTLRRADKLATSLEDKLQVENAIVNMPLESSVVASIIKEQNTIFDSAREFDRLAGN